MLAEALIMAIAAQGLDAFDDANLALTTCAFAAYRHANERDQSLDEFNRSLASRCSKPIAEMRAAMIAVDRRRGKSRQAASAAADAQIADFQTRFAAHYARRAKTNAQLRALERALRDQEKRYAQ